MFDAALRRMNRRLLLAARRDRGRSSPSAPIAPLSVLLGATLALVVALALRPSMAIDWIYQKQDSLSAFADARTCYEDGFDGAGAACDPAAEPSELAERARALVATLDGFVFAVEPAVFDYEDWLGRQTDRLFGAAQDDDWE